MQAAVLLVWGMRYQISHDEWRPVGALRHKLHMAIELWHLGRLVGAEQEITFREMLRRYRQVRRSTHASPREFFRYRLWDTSRPLSSRTEFLTWRKRRPLEAFLNPRSLTVEAKSKLKSHEIYVANDLPVPRQIGSWDPRRSGATELAALEALVSQEPRGIVMKPEHGVGGSGVQVFTACRDGRLLHASGEWWSFQMLAERMARIGELVVVQERVVAHPEIAELAGTTHAASLRLVTCLRSDGSVLLLPATLKLPSPVTGIDNFGAGNVAIAVDAAGIMGAAAQGLDGPPIERHPTTRVPFAGRPVPYYAEAVEVVGRGQRCFPLLRSIGWDVAITPEGPKLLEANPWWGVDVIQQPGLRGLLRGEFLEFLDEIGAGRVVAT